MTISGKVYTTASSQIQGIFGNREFVFSGDLSRSIPEFNASTAYFTYTNAAQVTGMPLFRGIIGEGPNCDSFKLTFDNGSVMTGWLDRPYSQPLSVNGAGEWLSASFISTSGSKGSIDAAILPSNNTDKAEDQTAKLASEVENVNGSGIVRVDNLSGVDLLVFVSKYGGDIGNDGWSSVPTGARNIQWGRHQLQAIVARAEHERPGTPGTSIGAWIPNSCTVTILGFDAIYASQN